MADPQSYRPSNLPTDPGVYRFFDENDKVIYVGKAKNLKNRINSYFGSNLQIKTRRMVKTATRVDWTIVKTELEALQLEFTWIKQFNPDFNVQFKDDKSYPYLAINLEAEYPRIFISRSKKLRAQLILVPILMLGHCAVPLKPLLKSIQFELVQSPTLKLHNGTNDNVCLEI